MWDFVVFASLADSEALDAARVRVCHAAATLKNPSSLECEEEVLLTYDVAEPSGLIKALVGLSVAMGSVRFVELFRRGAWKEELLSTLDHNGLERQALSMLMTRFCDFLEVAQPSVLSAEDLTIFVALWWNFQAPSSGLLRYHREVDA